jgi:large repetitive protein
MTLAIVEGAPTSPAGAAPVAPFTAVFHTQDNGAIGLFGNTVETCPISASTCLAARNGSATNGDLNTLDNNDYNMTFINIDPGPGIVDSSSADVTLPAGSTVLFAGLYWGGRQFAGTGGANATLPLNTMLLKGPGQTTYQTVTAATTVQIPQSTDATGPYQSYANVTSIVSAAGPGTWFGANVAASTGADRYGGWTLVVAYRNPGLPLRDLTVFNGFDSIGGSNSDTITISGFLAPFTGPVRTTVGIVAYEGDAGITGDALKLNSTALTTALRPANNFFDGAISNLGVNVTARNPPGANAATQGSYVNNFGFDVATVDASGIIANGATSATATFSTSGDQYYPGVLTTAIDLFAPSFPPVTKTVVDLSGHNPAQVGDKLEYTID